MVALCMRLIQLGFAIAFSLAWGNADVGDMRGSRVFLTVLSWGQAINKCHTRLGHGGQEHYTTLQGVLLRTGPARFQMSGSILRDGRANFPYLQYNLKLLDRSWSERVKQ